MPTIEETQGLIREQLLTPEQRIQKRNTAPPAPPNDLDIGMEAFNRGLGDRVSRKQKFILREAIQRGFVKRDVEGKLRTDNLGPLDPSFAPSPSAPQIKLLEDLDLLNLPTPQQAERAGRQKSFEESQKSFGQRVLEDVKQHPGETAGVLLSKPAPLATGFFTMAGDALDQHLQRAGILEGEAPQTPEEAGLRLGKAGAKGLGIGLVSKGISKIPSPFGNTVTKEGARAIKTVQGLPGGKKLVFPAEKAGESSMVDAMGNMAEVAILSSTTKFRNTQNLNAALDTAMKSVANTFSKGKTKEQIADTVSLIITNGREIFKRSRRGLFESIDALKPTVKKFTQKQGFKTKTLEDGSEVPIQVLDSATGLIKNVPNLKSGEVITKGGVNVTPAIKFLRKSLTREKNPQKKLPEAVKTLENLETGGPIISFQQADNNVIDIADFGFSSLTATTKDQGIARQAQKIIKQQMDKAAKQLPKEAFKQFKIAKRFAAIEQGVYQRTVIKKMLKDTKDFTPENVWNMVRSAGPENIKLIRQLMEPKKFIKQSMDKAAGKRPESRAVNEKTFWQNVQGRFLQDLMKTSEGDIKQKPIINQIDEAISSGRFKAMFPGPQGKRAAENFLKFADAKNVVLKPNPTGRMGLMVTVGQPIQALTVLGGLATMAAGEIEAGGVIAAGGVGLFLLPEAMAQFVTRKSLSQWLVRQTKAGADLGKATQGFLELANILTREKIDFEFKNLTQPEPSGEPPVVRGR